MEREENLQETDSSLSYEKMLSGLSGRILDCYPGAFSALYYSLILMCMEGQFSGAYNMILPKTCNMERPCGSVSMAYVDMGV